MIYFIFKNDDNESLMMRIFSSGLSITLANIKNNNVANILDSAHLLNKK